MSVIPRYTLRVPRDILDKITYIATQNDRSTNKEIERLLKKHIEEYEQQHGTIVFNN
ncbi:Arc family DNA-binding protein [Paenibacillus larvae]